MKSKYIVLIMLVVFVVIGGMLSMLFLLQQSKASKAPDVGVFAITEYQWEIENFPVDKNVGQVNDKNVGIEKAKYLWLEKYGISINERKIEVSYDFKEECWHIYGILPPNTLGGVPHSIIRKSGEVLAVWIDD